MIILLAERAGLHSFKCSRCSGTFHASVSRFSFFSFPINLQPPCCPARNRPAHLAKNSRNILVLIPLLLQKAALLRQRAGSRPRRFQMRAQASEAWSQRRAASGEGITWGLEGSTYPITCNRRCPITCLHKQAHIESCWECEIVHRRSLSYTNNTS